MSKEKQDVDADANVEVKSHIEGTIEGKKSSELIKIQMEMRESLSCEKLLLFVCIVKFY